MFYKVDVFEKFAKSTKKHQFWSHLLIKSLLTNKETPVHVFSNEFSETFKITFFTEHIRTNDFWKLSFSLTLCTPIPDEEKKLT